MSIQTERGAPQPAETRISSDGHAYTWMQYIEHFGADAERRWNEAYNRSIMRQEWDGRGGALQPAESTAVVRRIAMDGQAYSWTEFFEQYGGHAQEFWDEAYERSTTDQLFDDAQRSLRALQDRSILRREWDGRGGAPQPAESTADVRCGRATQSMINLTVSLDMNGRLIAVQCKHLQADGITLKQADELSDLLMVEEGIDKLRQSLRPLDYLEPAPEPLRTATDQQERRCNAAHATPPGTPPESPLDPVRPHSSFCEPSEGFCATEQQKPRCNAAHATPPGTPPDIGSVAPVTPQLPRVVIDLEKPPSWVQRSRSRSRHAKPPMGRRQ